MEEVTVYTKHTRREGWPGVCVLYSIVDNVCVRNMAVPPFPPQRESELAVILFDSVCDIGASHAIGNSAHFSLVALAKVETAKICC